MRLIDADAMEAEGEGVMEDLISRQAAVNAIRLYECDDNKINMGLIIAMNLIEEVPSAQPDSSCPHYIRNEHDRGDDSLCRKFQCEVSALPSAQQTLYGYKIEHLAYIARVMDKEGVTAEYAVRTFDDMGRAIKMIVEEAQEIVYATLFCERRETDGAD